MLDNVVTVEQCETNFDRDGNSDCDNKPNYAVPVQTARQVRSIRLSDGGVRQSGQQDIHHSVHQHWFSSTTHKHEGYKWRQFGRPNLVIDFR